MEKRVPPREFLSVEVLVDPQTIVARFPDRMIKTKLYTQGVGSCSMQLKILQLDGGGNIQTGVGVVIGRKLHFKIGK